MKSGLKSFQNQVLKGTPPEIEWSFQSCGTSQPNTVLKTVSNIVVTGILYGDDCFDICLEMCLLILQTIGHSFLN